MIVRDAAESSSIGIGSMIGVARSSRFSAQVWSMPV